MDENNIIDAFDSARKVRLTSAEKSAGGEILRSFMALKPVRETGAARHAAAKPKVGPSLFILIVRPMSVFAIVLALMLSAGGVSYAAEGALPGDTLYPVKVVVNEEVRSMLTVSAEAKAEWEAERAERRLGEAEELAARGRLEAGARAELEEKFRERAEKVKDRIEEFEAEGEDDSAASLSARLESSLRAHKKILQSIEAEDDDEREEMGSLAAAVDDESRHASERRRKTENEVSLSTATEARTAAEGRRAAAERKINEVRSFLSKSQSRLGVEAVAKAESRLIAAEGLVGQGNARFEAGEYGEAFVLYLKAHRVAQEGKSLIRAKSDLKVNVDLNGAADIDDEDDDAADENEDKDGERVDDADDEDGDAEAKDDEDAKDDKDGAADENEDKDDESDADGRDSSERRKRPVGIKGELETEVRVDLR